ncbi:hypothetical protein [endosymbiont GvMRE of Glomus versiforme]|uniref:hypothetical protein n=1 Tax=endosymbiont GvMRE of Glomus versiforme TaxID=2039283 RepID=UPI000EB8CEAE|nr:hypothetical protein [endosymbiont GvMRE of Glomus versiforme]RHZ35457.1 hypothetical protein GvMRE_IIg180 [endosymbiont GvMRE of Glomus versiforme]
MGSIPSSPPKYYLDIILKNKKQSNWGKVCLDKKIIGWEAAKKQARADLAYHEKKECATVNKTGKTLTMF